MLSEKCTTAGVIESSVMQDQQEVSRTKAETIKVFTALESRKVKLMELLEEQQSVAVQSTHHTTAAGDRRQQPDQNRAAGTFIDRGRVQAPAGLPSISSPSTTKHHLLHLDRVRSAVAKMEETLDEQMEIIIRELSPVDEEETGEEPVQAEKVFDDDLWKLQSQYVINVTLDPNREPPSLILSEDRRQVRDGG